jgi:hypothetical protein
VTENSDEKTGTVKYINEREKALKQTTNPDYYKTYEFDVYFPDDWQLKIEVKDASNLILSDDLIGQTIIDLEDRYFGNAYITAKRTLEIYKDIESAKKRGLENRSRK